MTIWEWIYAFEEGAAINRNGAAGIGILCKLRRHEERARRLLDRRQQIDVGNAFCAQSEDQRRKALLLGQFRRHPFTPCPMARATRSVTE